MIYLILPSFSTLTEFTTCLDLQFLTVFQEEVTFIYRVSQPKNGEEGSTDSFVIEIETIFKFYVQFPI